MRILLTFLLFNALPWSGYGQYNFDLINSIYDEQHPVMSSTGKALFFTRANHPDNIGGISDKGDIWYSLLIEEQWSAPIHAGFVINSNKWNGILGFSNNGNTMLLHAHYQDDKQGLSIAQKKNEEWSTPTSLKIPYFFNRSIFQSGSISDDEKVIVLSMDSYNTKGEEDIYVLFKQMDGSWSDPKNLGIGINTKYQEISPYLAEDNKTLFFASNGYSNSQGSFDIYKTIRRDDSWLQWSTPVNLGKKINTEGRESSYRYFPDLEIAVYTSTQDSNGYGDIKFISQQQTIRRPVAVKADTIHRVVVPNLVINPTKTNSNTINTTPVFLFVGTVENDYTDEPIEATLFLTKIAGGSKSIYKTNNGAFNISLPLGAYHLGVEAKEYLSRFLTVDVNSAQAPHQITMLPIAVGERVNLKSVLFVRGTDELLLHSYDELDAVAKMMEENLSMEIMLAGHTDNRGSSKLNYDLSEKRVLAVRKYLQSKGISRKRIEGRGYGGSQPLVSNKNEMMRKLNRRVEFIVTKE